MNEQSTLQNPEQLIDDMGRRARSAAATVARASTETKTAALRHAAAALRAQKTEILAANAQDMERGKKNGLTPALLDRLKLDPERIDDIAAAIEAISGLADPVGAIIDDSEPPNGLKLSRVRVPLGVVGIIYESRPNVTADAGALCLMAGNAVILRGGSEAVASNRAIQDCLVAGLRAAGLSEDAIQLVPTTDRAAVGAMLRASGVIDIIVPRGGKGLVARVQDEARIPVLAHLDGICHTFIHRLADPDMAAQISVNAKMRRPGVCGAMETLLIDCEFSEPETVLNALIGAGCSLRGDHAIQAIDDRITEATPEDWDTEYLEPVLSVAMVEDLDAALAHIAQDTRHRVGRRQPRAKDALDAIQHARRHLLVFPGHTPQDRLSRFRRLVDLDERHGVLLET